ncbi:MAG: hypothetical protein ACK46X_21795 [Candidatus Sericytochromatia bacterium]
MTVQTLNMEGLKQAFEDFIAHEAEWAIAEATRDSDSDKRLWVVLYDDGRYALAHQRHEAEPPIHHDAGATEIAFPVEPLSASERDPVHLEDSRFDAPIERLWDAYRQAVHARLGR